MGFHRQFLAIGLLALTALCGAFLFPGDARAQALNLNGEWAGQYQCPTGAVYPLRAHVTHNGQQVTGVRLKGDTCFTQDNVTLFQGMLNGNTGAMQCAVLSAKANSYDNSRSFAQNLLQGLAEGAAGANQYDVSYVQDSIQLTGANTFTACTIAWTRVNGGAPGPSAVNNSAAFQQTTTRFQQPGQVQQAPGGFTQPGQMQQAPGGFAQPGQFQQAPGGFAQPGQQQVAQGGYAANTYALACLYLDPRLPLPKVNFQFRIGNGQWQTSDTSAGYVSSLYYLIPGGGGAQPATVIQFQSALAGGQAAVVTYSLNLTPTASNDCVVSQGQKYRWAMSSASQFHIDLVPY